MARFAGVRDWSSAREAGPIREMTPIAEVTFVSTQFASPGMWPLSQ